MLFLFSFPGSILSQPVTSRLVTQIGNLSGVRLVAISKNNKLAMTSSGQTTGKDYSICLWDYAGEKLNLRFAAKDAEDIYRTINVGGKNLFGIETNARHPVGDGRRSECDCPNKGELPESICGVRSASKARRHLFCLSFRTRHHTGTWF